jgi:phosphoribosyl 1,2-cyclic phosphodiesterase
MATLKFWGVRGSIPTPGPATVRYGGNTSCCELRFNDTLFILDAGSGLRVLGNELLKSKPPINANIFISHMHWDHIQGIPFFTPAFIPGNKFTFYGAKDAEKDLNDIIADQMDPTYFPIEMKDMGSKLEFEQLAEGRYNIDNTEVETIFVNHPGNALGYKFFIEQKSLIYISDNEPFAGTFNDDLNQSNSNKDIILGEDGNQKLIAFLKNADILIHDAQYTLDEYKKKMTWGHSPIEYTVDIAIHAGVKQLVLFHHDPMHDDDTIDEMLENSRKYASGKKSKIIINAAAEGETLNF